MKIKSIDDVRTILMNEYFEEDVFGKIKESEKNRLEGFLKSYSLEKLKVLNSNQIVLLYIMFFKQSENTDHLSFTFGRTRRATVNTANALVRKRFLFWDTPDSSNNEDGYELTLDFSFLDTDEFL